MASMIPLTLIVLSLVGLGEKLHSFQPEFRAAQLRADQQQRERRSQQNAPPIENPETPAQSSHDEERGTDARPLIVQTKPTEKQAAENKQERDSESLYRRANLALTGALCIITLVTGFFVGWQAYETRQAAQATRDATQQTERHFELLNAQWLDTSHFYIEAVTVVDTTGAPSSLMWSIDLHIANNTPLKITLTSIEMFIADEKTILWTGKTIGPRNSMKLNVPATILSPEHAQAARALS